MAAIARAQSLEGARTVASQAQAQQQLTSFLNYGARLPARLRADVPLMRGSRLNIARIGRAAGFVLIVAGMIVAAAIQFARPRRARPNAAMNPRRDPERSARARTGALPGDRYGRAD